MFAQTAVEQHLINVFFPAAKASPVDPRVRPGPGLPRSTTVPVLGRECFSRRGCIILARTFTVLMCPPANPPDWECGTSPFGLCPWEIDRQSPDVDVGRGGCTRAQSRDSHESGLVFLQSLALIGFVCTISASIWFQGSLEQPASHTFGVAQSDVHLPHPYSLDSRTHYHVYDIVHPPI